MRRHVSFLKQHLFGPVCFGFGKTQILLFKYFTTSYSAVVFDEHLKGADTETSPSHVLLSFISHIRVNNSGSFVVL